MLTKNFYSYMRGALQKASDAKFTRTDGDTNVLSFSSSDTPPFKAMNSWAKSATTTGVSFGTGTTPATASDYCLESILTSTEISVSVPSAVSFSRGDSFDEYSVSFGVTNITAETINISEVGLIALPQSTWYVLVDRTVLDTPITIPAGQSKQITYTIRFNYGDAV